MKRLFQKIKKHLWPQNNNIQSVAEIAGYLIVLAFALFVFWKIQRVPAHEETIAIESLGAEVDSVLNTHYANVSYHMPMSYSLDDSYGLGRLRISFDHEPKSFYYSEIGQDQIALYNKYYEYQKMEPKKGNILFYAHSHLENTAIVLGFDGDKEPYINDKQINYRYKTRDGAIETEWYRTVPYDMELKTIKALLTTAPYSRPSWWSLYDVSQSYYIIRLEGNMKVKSLEFDFVGAVDFSTMYPEPDVLTMNSISFVDLQKIQEIKEHGLKFHAKFIELERNQTIRLFIVSAVLSALFAIFIAVFVLCCCRVLRSCRNNRMEKKREKKAKKKTESDNLIENNQSQAEP